jgi:uncharacterized protein (DUF2126 family)/transglutaminase-like putative cysteine protease
MSIHVAIHHKTTYTFDRPVRLSPHVVRLRPAPHCRTPILSYSLKVEPTDHFVNWQQDPFGNYLARFVFPEPTSELDVMVDVVADMTIINPFDFFIDDEAKSYPFAYDRGLAQDLSPYLAASDGLPLLDKWMTSLPSLPVEGLAIVDFLVQINAKLCSDIAYSIRMEPGVQSPDETLRQQLGSCRDTAWLLVQVLRRKGLAARFVSGYLVQLAADIAAVDGPSGPTADFTDLHAWAEVFVPGAGWIGLDPTSGLFAGEGHIPLAATPEPFSAAAITGMLEPCETTMSFANVVMRIREDPRVTLPYSEAQWRAIDALGQSVDEVLNANDVRLTMGGEPTFVSAKDMEAPEWTVAADGPAKRKAGADMAARLAERFANGGFVHYGQGKWYPGEPLPRWQISLFWRTDGQPLWRNPALFVVDPSEPGSADLRAMRALSVALANRLGVPRDCVVEAFEDPLYELWTEARMPLGTPSKTLLASADAAAGTAMRAAFIDQLDARRGDPVAMVIPLHRPPGTVERWGTCRWTLRRGQLYLLPGDSPSGLRLPLDALTWYAPPTEPDASPFDEHPPLSSPHKVSSVDGNDPGLSPAVSPVDGVGDPTGVVEVAEGVEGVEDTGAAEHREFVQEGSAPVREPSPATVVAVSECPPTALSVELRNGHLFVFLPPFAQLADVVELLTVIEDAADQCGVCVVLEGYSPPRDPRLQTLVVAPDPGVLEINVHPAGSWNDLVEITTTVHEFARLALLGTETFQLDGRHSGTGGGNHITIGAAQAKDSPLLRRPDLLQSMITFWQHHPSLSYLFSGRFIGPTSQAPRVDEGRAETLYELEIAFAELERLCDARPVQSPTDQQGSRVNRIGSALSDPSEGDPVQGDPVQPDAVHTDTVHPDTAQTRTVQREDAGETGQGETAEEEAAGRKVATSNPPPWLVDRLLRHLLTDITGNTHRAEFCVDKLFSPDSERGRLGLLELRGFEMPPHPQMALVQALLVRSLVARMWTNPYRHPLVRWGTDLHDRFLLPHFCAADISEVIADLQDHGFAFDQSWMAPFLEFRFPRLGSVNIGDVHLELRAAIEPWHVLGEEVSAQSTARYVDSSVERLQVKTIGLTEGRHVVTCNGVVVPLRPTETIGVHIAGVRYRAWQPPSALHPTIGVHSPLTFDLIDLWSGRSVGGCTYHVSHPGGVAYETFPVNANSAEARRRSRFDTLSHTPGPLDADTLAYLSANSPGASGSGSGVGGGSSADQQGRVSGSPKQKFSSTAVQEYPRTLDLRRTSR